MSGDPPVVVFGTGLESPVKPLLAALEKVLADLPRRAVLVGGLAVAARLGRVERATGDVDAVIDAPDDPPSADVLVASGVARERISANSVLVDGVKVDLIDTFAVRDDAFEDALGGNEHFAAAHRFGFETASAMRLVVEHGPEITLQVAEPAGLVAMKLHAAEWRRDRERKVAGDLFDLYRLLRVFDREGEVAATIRRHPGLNRLCLASAEAVFIERLTTHAGLLSRSDDAVIASVTRDDLAGVGDALVERLRGI